MKTVFAALAFIALAACSGGSSSSPAPAGPAAQIAPAVAVSHAAVAQVNATNTIVPTTSTLKTVSAVPLIPQAVRPTVMPSPWGIRIYVANLSNNSVTTYAANGERTNPTITKGVNEPDDVAVARNGNIYVVNYINSGYGNTVTTYTSNGMQTTPTLQIANAQAVAVAPDGTIYVLTDSTLTTYTAEGHQIAPTLTANSIAGNSRPGNFFPNLMAVGPDGKLYLSFFAVSAGNGLVAGDNIVTYTPKGKRTTPTIPNVSGGIAVDAYSKIYVASNGSGSVTTYTSKGQQTTPTITGLNFPNGVAVDDGKIYVTNTDSNTVTTYNANGKQIVPTITTGLSEPYGIAVH